MSYIHSALHRSYHLIFPDFLFVNQLPSHYHLIILFEEEKVSTILARSNIKHKSLSFIEIFVGDIFCLFVLFGLSIFVCL